MKPDLYMKLNLYPVLIATGVLMFATVIFAQAPPSASSADRSARAESSNTTTLASSAAETANTGVVDVSQGISALTFIENAIQNGMTEVKLASLAIQNSKSEDVRKFANQIQSDHVRANSELEAIAVGKHVPVARSLDSTHQAAIAELSGKSGAAFDAAYVRHVATAHRRDVALFSAGAKSLDSDISAYAARTLPSLEGQQAMAEGLESKIKVAAAGRKSADR
jgi:putative membrane protein